MDDYSSGVLSDSKNEWSIILMNYLCPHIIDGFRSIFNEAVKLCTENDEEERYLMTYQNLLSRITKWNQTMIDAEKDRIITLCNCSYLEDILTCVHIVQLKILSCVRVGAETKKVNIDIPDFSAFIHLVYTNIARKLYSAIYLFEIDIQPLEQQKRNREFELMVQTCIMNTIRDKIPIETLLRQYIDETQEREVIKVERVIDTKPIESKPIESKPIESKPIESKPMNAESEEAFTIQHIPQEVKSKSRPLINENIFDIPEPKVGFTDKNSVLTFESEKDETDLIKIGEPVSFDDLGAEDLDLSKSKTESVNIDIAFEEL